MFQVPFKTLRSETDVRRIRGLSSNLLIYNDSQVVGAITAEMIMEAVRLIQNGSPSALVSTPREPSPVWDAILANAGVQHASH